MLCALSKPKHAMNNPIKAERLKEYLKELPPFSLIHGTEAQLAQEALFLLRQKAQQQGFEERLRLELDRRHESFLKIRQHIETPSLFAPKNLIEIHGEIKTIDKKNGQILEQISQMGLSQSRIIFYLPNLEKSEQKSWFKALLKKGLLNILCKTLSNEQFRKEIQKRMQEKNIKMNEQALQQFLLYHENNLAAAEQGLERLNLNPKKQNLSLEDIEKNFSDSSQQNNYLFRQSFLKQHYLKSYHRLLNIEQSDKQLITLMIWTLARDSMLLLNLKQTPKESHPDLYKNANIYHWQIQEIEQACQQRSLNQIRQEITLANKLDRMNKGVEKGDPWLSLKQYCLLRAQKQYAR